MKSLIVEVEFKGAVAVEVPDHLTNADAELLAGKLATARILATTDNPDAPEDVACDEYLKEGSVHASEQDWDKAQIVDVGGEWTGKVKKAVA